MEETVAVKKEIVEEPDLADLVAKITLENKEWNEKNDSMNRNKSCVVPPAKLDPGDPLILDARSRQGCFGWTDGPITLPYIFRNDDKFCFVHFLQKRATEFFDKFLVPELIACFRMPSWRITSEESCLMNEINATHSSFKFGRYHFSSRELIVSLSDAVQMIEFLRIVKKKLQSNTWAEEDRCGFIKIGERWVVPYIIISGTKYFPLFYFEGEMEEMEKKAFRIQGWDLAYLKFCCSVQGIRKELFNIRSCRVVSVDEVIKEFPTEMSFQPFSPNRPLSYSSDPQPPSSISLSILKPTS